MRSTLTDFRRIEYRTAAEHVCAHHYSGCMPSGRNICFGWYIDGALYAVAVYGNGVNPYQASYLSRTTGLPITNQSYVELKRLARADKREGFPLTWFLARAHKDLRADGYRLVISFSDPAHGHAGGIYKAANFIYAGKTKAEWHCVSSDGEFVHRRVAYRHARRHGITIAEARQVLDLTPTKTPQKTRWVLPLVSYNKVKQMFKEE